MKIFINGYGNIGRRLATAFSLDPDIELVGIAKYSLDSKINEAHSKGYNVFIPESLISKFSEKAINYSGTIQDAIKFCDLVIDASKEGLGYKNKKNFYSPMKKMAIFQGGEDRHGPNSVADVIHNSRVNYDQVSNKSYVIQGSCNVSGMGRIMKPLIENFGNDILRYDVTLIRRWADLEDSKEVKDSIEWTEHPHHQDDVKDFLPTANLFVDAYKVPSRMMHVHQMNIRFKNLAPSKDKVLEIFKKEFGVAILQSAKGTVDVRKKALDLNFVHGDTNMVHIHHEVTRKQDDVLKISYSDDQTGMVIPENYLLVQSMYFNKNRDDAIKKTDNIFSLSQKKKILEDEFN